MELRSAGMRLEGIDGAREFYEAFIPSTEWVICFPWDPERRKLRGEIIYSIRRID